ncbi:MAG: CBS domain-containing protein [Conexivisphaerales archaeon]
MIPVSDLMTKNVLVAKKTDKILDIRRSMIERKISRIVIVDEKNVPVGIITDKDILRFAIKDTSGVDLDDVSAEKIMSHPLIITQESSTIQEASKKMYDVHTSSLVVVNKAGDLAGIITKTDLCAFFALSMRGKASVQQFMSSPAITIKPSQTIFYAAYLMESRKISHLVVADRILEGMLTLSDMVTIVPFISKQRTRDDEPIVYRSGLMVPKEYIHLLTVRDFMTRHPITTEKKTDLAEAAKLMLMHKISGLPVVDNKRKVLGIVTKTDILRALATYA